MAAKLKANGGIRPLAVGTAIRRITAAAIHTTHKQQIHKAAGKHQYGVGRPNGADQVFKLIEQRFTEHPTHTIIHLDIANAFTSLPRQHMVSAIAANCPPLAPTAQTWYTRPTTTLWRDSAGTTHKIQTDCGVAQGCALSAAIYAITTANTNADIQETLTTLTRDDHTNTAAQPRILAYLDDTYLLVPTVHAPAALEATQRHLQRIGLELNTTKTEMTTRGPHHPQLTPHYKPNLHVMGVTHAVFKGLEDNLPEDQLPPGTPLQPDDNADAILVAQAHFCTALLRLHNQQLLRPSTTMTLLRNFHNNVPVHRLRATTTSDEVAKRWETLLCTTLCTILETQQTDVLSHAIHLPTDLGGLGIHDVNTRRHVAYYSAWRQTAYHANEELCATTEHEWRANNPTSSKLLLATAAALQPLTDTPLDIDWNDWIAEPPNKHTQKLLLRSAYSQFHQKLLHALPPEQQAITRSAGGKGAAAWLYPPPDANTHMPRKHYLTALRYRTHTPQPTSTHDTCQHKNDKRTCQHPLDPYGHHALTCAIGGYTTTKHNHLRDILHRWLSDMGHTCHREQHVPELDDTHNGEPRKAIMDVVCTTHTGHYLIDISVTDAVSECPKHTASNARHNNTAANAREQDKRKRYNNHPQLIPFVLETGGRWGTTAEEFIRSIAPTDTTERTEALTQLRYMLACSLQRNNADMILTATN